MARENVRVARDGGEKTPYRVFVRGNVLRDTRPPFAVRLFHTSRTAFAAGLGAEAHAMENHRKWQEDEETAKRAGITRAEAQARRIASGDSSCTHPECWAKGTQHVCPWAKA